MKVEDVAASISLRRAVVNPATRRWKMSPSSDPKLLQYLFAGVLHRGGQHRGRGVGPMWSRTGSRNCAAYYAESTRSGWIAIHHARAGELLTSSVLAVRAGTTGVSPVRPISMRLCS